MTDQERFDAIKAELLRMINDFCLYSHTGGNIDDAYELGWETCHAWMGETLRLMLEKVS